MEEILEPSHLISSQAGLGFSSCPLSVRRDRMLTVSGGPLFCPGDSISDVWVLS